MEIQSVFVANDGTQFATEAECLRHEVRLKDAATVDKFLVSSGNKYSKAAQCSIARASILAYLSFIAGDVPEEAGQAAE